MKTRPIVPARLAATADGVPSCEDYADVYHPRAGALQQALHVFLRGNGLPERWRGRERFVVLETGFGLGNNFLVTWDAWRCDPLACRRLHFISVERHPLTRDDLRSVARDAVVRPLADQLVAAWPPLTPNLHRLVFEGGRVELLLALGDVADWLPELVAQVDAFYLDGFAPAKNPDMWQPRLFKAMGRLAAPQATAATWTAARGVRDGLRAAGFDVHTAPGQGGKRDITLARYAPSFTPRHSPGRSTRPPGIGHAAIVGAGLAGCAVASALAQQGWRCTLIDRQSGPAQETSGNPVGLFHGIVNAQDGVHARFNRGAALLAQRCVEQAIERHGVRGSVGGVLRLETMDTDVQAMTRVLERLGLPGDYVRALDAASASESAGMRLQHPAWFYPGGGWVRPAELSQALLRDAGGSVEFRPGIAVQALRHAGDAWQLMDAAGTVVVRAEVVVLANGGDALRLIGEPAWDVMRVRGQLSSVASAAMPVHARIPIAGAGYLLPSVDGTTVFGATSQPGDDDPSVRDDDHLANLFQLGRLTGLALDVPLRLLGGRTAWRWVSGDRLPIVGAVPDIDAARGALRLEQPRFVPRQPGLHVFTALASRGITWCALGAQALASAIAGAPSPLEASLLDAVDPARFVSRKARRPAP
ncbi:bifunctional tRNA (5-methylaminomethyl-2-thiouridine)(34)-methyltransferase MnmD/FAD-dependent 5-carboxymethylaminomethyl-2-thiouridine(34) oxidoreductase MnmC [Piscinibacter sp. XHJ-5]|uniref:bifunctional tRNA (5-methylaminomethyl-2-thiouridine)(34)-methyltransferase MnmD/FAD-dependent 5-carboxymethylaminomethyl-2-thiouridine(34) oxidoreductase MnmC n=1 Tax=Piscinibacter sp. XHJ-5 TaxID=3037797 RepID=UPI0024536B68|nr:bifunctional tRNA (5-methylaminomethyl-2-thiouridine)(34)-methyltransferase MnmD/FAD-dependent 5-carboxymethylaminomethyl-2-thiouridine(34) oxidoreductase MnmC [Piscinibacter sp. XHJ-5]